MAAELFFILTYLFSIVSLSIPVHRCKYVYNTTKLDMTKLRFLCQTPVHVVYACRMYLAFSVYKYMVHHRPWPCRLLVLAYKHMLSAERFHTVWKQKVPTNISTSIMDSYLRKEFRAPKMQGFIVNTSVVGLNAAPRIELYLVMSLSSVFLFPQASYEEGS